MPPLFVDVIESGNVPKGETGTSLGTDYTFYLAMCRSAPRLTKPLTPFRR
jgi:hypothetical protein